MGCWMMAKVARFKAVSVELWGYGGVLDDGRLTLNLRWDGLLDRAIFSS